MADLGKLTAPRKKITIQGQEWEFSPLTLRDNEELLDEMVAKWPKPLEVIKQHLAGLPDGERLELLKMACAAELRPRFPNAVEFEDWKRGPFGGPRCWRRMLLPANSTIEREDAFVLWSVAPEETHQLVWSIEELPLGNSSGPAQTGPPAATPG